MSIELRREDADAIRLVPKKYEREALLIHGYGGSKEEMLPLGFRLAAAGIGCLMTDLPGHGNSGGLFDHETATAALNAILKRHRFDVLVGHSVGALLAAAADYPAVCLSPPLDVYFEGNIKELVTVLRARGVREKKYFAGLKDVIEKTRLDFGEKRICVIYGYGDLKTVKDFALRAKKAGIETLEVKDASHRDIVTSSATAGMTVGWIKKNGRRGPGK